MPKEKFHIVRGRDLETGLPKTVKLTSVEIREALSPILREISKCIIETIEEVPPELIGDITDRGIVLAGGGALLAGIDKAISEATHMPVVIAEDPLTCVVRGCGILLENDSLLNKIKLTG